MRGKGKQGAGAGRERKVMAGQHSEHEENGSMLKQTLSQWFMEGGQALQLGKLTYSPSRGERRMEAPQERGAHHE